MRDSVEKEVEEMLRELDLDGDGKVRMEDFVRLLVSDQVNGEKKKIAMPEEWTKNAEEILAEYAVPSTV